MSEPAPLAPAGWYSTDVPGEERWWDGTAWTLHARPAPAALPVASPTARGFWRGSKEGSLIVAIFCVLMIIPTGLLTLGALLSGSIRFPQGAVFLLGFTSFAVLGLLNFFGVRRQQAADRAMLAAPQEVQPPE